MLQYVAILARLKSPNFIGPPLMFANISISEFDPELAQAIASEGERQEAHIELIASENYCNCFCSFKATVKSCAIATFENIDSCGDAIQSFKQAKFPLNLLVCSEGFN